MSFRRYSFTDQCFMTLDTTLKTLAGHGATNSRDIRFEAEQSPLSLDEKRQSAGMMRVNYSGEICAQALYMSQALTSRSEDTKTVMRRAAYEEEEHLLWCGQRLEELGSRSSYFDPLWYAGSFMLGAIAGLSGDTWNLGFLAETEHQVEEHLKGHLSRLPLNDNRSRAIVSQMANDEAEHARTAEHCGARTLPPILRLTMRMTATLMTRTSTYI